MANKIKTEPCDTWQDEEIVYIHINYTSKSVNPFAISQRLVLCTIVLPTICKPHLYFSKVRLI